MEEVAAKDDTTKWFADELMESKDAISIESQQTQSIDMSLNISEFTVSNKSDNFCLWEIEFEYWDPHNSAFKCWKPLSLTELFILMIV